MPTPRNLFILSLIFSLILPWPLVTLAENRYYDPSSSKEELCGDEQDQDGNGQAETLLDCACPEQITTEEFTKIRSFITESQLILIQRKDDHSQDTKYFPWDKTGKNNLFCPLTDALLYYLYQELAKITPPKATTSKFYYFHNDHLSGTTVVTDEQGNLVETRDYYPYGEDRPLSKTAESIPPLPPNQPPKFDSPTKNIPATPYGFTGKEQDTETGLHYFGSRFYNAAIGRFTQQDPAARDNPEKFLKDPQQLNTYSYARNNPQRYVDPKGEYIMPISEELKAQYPWLSPSLTSNQQKADQIVQSIVPYYGDLQDSYEGGTGLDYQTGEPLEAWQTWTSRVAKFIPFVSGRLVRKAEGLVGEGIEKVKRVFGGKTGIAEKTLNNPKWQSWDSYEKTIIDGKEYANIGGRLYSEHAVLRMMPKGLTYPNGRSIAPNFVEQVIQKGAQTKQTVNGIDRVLHRSGSVGVITENDTVVSIITNLPE